MQTKWYHYEENILLTIWFSIIWLLPILFIVILIWNVNNTGDAPNLATLFLIALVFFISQFAILTTYVTIYTTPIAIGITDENLIIKRMVGEIFIPWESITHFYPLHLWRFLPRRDASWGISSPHLPIEFKFLYWFSYFADWTRGRGFLQPTVFIPEGIGLQKEAIQSIRAHIEQARQSVPPE